MNTIRDPFAETPASSATRVHGWPLLIARLVVITTLLVVVGMFALARPTRGGTDEGPGRAGGA
jgi:hypothetical protein